MNLTKVEEKLTTVYCVGFRSDSSGGFDWFPSAELADDHYVNTLVYFGDDDFPREVVRFDVNVPPDLSSSGITEYIDLDLDFYMTNNSVKPPIGN